MAMGKYNKDSACPHCWEKDDGVSVNMGMGREGGQGLGLRINFSPMVNGSVG